MVRLKPRSLGLHQHLPRGCQGPQDLTHHRPPNPILECALAGSPVGNMSHDLNPSALMACEGSKWHFACGPKWRSRPPGGYFWVVQLLPTVVVETHCAPSTAAHHPHPPVREFLCSSHFSDEETGVHSGRSEGRCMGWGGVFWLLRDVPVFRSDPPLGISRAPSQNAKPTTPLGGPALAPLLDLRVQP